MLYGVILEQTPGLKTYHPTGPQGDSPGELLAMLPPMGYGPGPPWFIIPGMLFMPGPYGEPVPIMPWGMLGYPGGLDIPSEEKKKKRK